MVEILKPKWLEIAEKEIGVKEISGNVDNQRIVEYHAETSLHAQDDETPWCSSFVNWCVNEAGYHGSGKANARSWLAWGVLITIPVLGCVVVLQRGDSNVSGHVGFFYGYDGQDKIKILGGNQGDQVSIASFSKNKVLGYRWL